MSTTTTMQAFQFTKPGPTATALQSVTIPRPNPSSLAADQILIKPLACSLNPADYKVAELGVIGRLIIQFPNTIGMDVSGRVQAVGSGVSDVRAGDVVVGRMNPFKTPGGLAEVAVAERSRIAKVPEGVDPVEAAALPTGGLTAWQTIAPHVNKDGGSRVLINGATGGVGAFSVQVAKLLGCRVTVTASSGKGAELSKELGADEVIDYKKTDVVKTLKEDGREFDLIVDNIGDAPADLYSSSRTYLGDGKPYVFVGGRMTLKSVFNLLLAKIVPAFLGGVRGTFSTYLTKDSPEELEKLLGFVKENKIKVVVDSKFPFKDTKAAFEHLKTGSVKGKVIITMDDE